MPKLSAKVFEIVSLPQVLDPLILNCGLISTAFPQEEAVHEELFGEKLILSGTYILLNDDALPILPLRS